MDDPMKVMLFLAIGVILFLVIVLFIGRSTDSPEDVERKRLENERQRLEIEKLRSELRGTPDLPQNKKSAGP